VIVLLLVALFVFAAAPPAHAQLSFSNLLELQLGNLPQTDPSNRVDTYEQLDATLAFRRVRAGMRFESNQNSEEHYPYSEVTQRWFEFEDPHFRGRVGNYTTILGRGLLHRSFTLPAVVLDQPGLRSRYGFMRDVDGVRVEGTLGPIAVRGIQGRPNLGDLSPGIANEFDLPRYLGSMYGGQVVGTVWRDARVGVHYLRFTPDGVHQNEFGSGSVEIDPLHIAGAEGLALPIYVEYARQNPSFGDWLEFRAPDGTPMAVYGGINLLWGNLGISAEWKDYTEFALGINDPPSLVREHNFVLPNRSTHVLEARDEEGYQFEASYRFDRWGSLVANTSRADGKVSASLPPRRFEERYGELNIEPAAYMNGHLSVFYDYSRDDWVGIHSRDITGGRVTHRVPKDLTAEVDVEGMRVHRGTVRFDEQYFSFTLTHTRLGAVGVVWFRTFDPAEIQDELPRNYVGGVISAPLGDHHVLTLFGGQRREGLACTAGTCYRVDGFEGFEMRLTSRF